MPSAFGEHLQRGLPDEIQIAILKTAYAEAPARFLELLGRFIDAQNRVSGDVYILDRVAPVWDSRIADVVRAKLTDERFDARAFRSILAALMKVGDEAAFQIATEIVKSATDAPPDEIEKPIEAVLGLLNAEPAAAWDVFWPVLQKNPAIAGGVFSRLAIDPYSFGTTHCLQGLRERQLGDFGSWVAKRRAADGLDYEIARTGPMVGGFTLVTGPPNRGWYWLNIVIINELIGRGTSEAVATMKQLKPAPGENVGVAITDAEEILRQRTWKPLSPSELIDLIASSPALPVSDADAVSARSPSDRAGNIARLEPDHKRRGRKSKFSIQQLERAQQMKSAGKSNHQIAKVLYGPSPSDGHRRSVPTILNYHFGPKDDIEK